MSESRKPGSIRKLLLPNSSPLGNFVYDEMLRDPDMPFYVMKVLLLFVRQTIGWDKLSEEFSSRYVEQQLNIGSSSYEHALKLLCDCWQLFSVERGVGRRKSLVTIRVENFNMHGYAEHVIATANIYGTATPSYKQLVDYPCTPEMIEAEIAKWRAKVSAAAGKAEPVHA